MPKSQSSASSIENDSVAPIVTMHLWGIPTRTIPIALSRMVSQRRAIAQTHGLRFAKLLGTGSGNTFSIREADPHHWGVLAVWNSEADARVFEHGAIVAAWDKDATERAEFVMRPLSTRGSWSRREPFTPVATAPWDGPVASITRARIRLRKMNTFRRAVPPIVTAVARAPGMRLTTGIGEAPVGLQGTFSIWDSSARLNAFAYETTAHAQAIADTDRVGWYSEELFARFALLRASGTFSHNSMSDVTG